MSENNINEFDKLWDYNKPGETEKKFRKLIPEAEKLKDKSKYLELLTQIARTEGLQRRFEDAHKTLDKAMKMILPEHITPRIRYMLERGRVYNSSKETEKAAEIFNAAFQQAVKYQEDFYAIDAAHMMGIAEKEEESLKWNEIAIGMAEESKDKRANGWLGSLYNNTAWTYHDMKQYEKALELFEKNVKWHSERNSNQKMISIARWSVARTLRSMGKINEALEIQMELEREMNEKQIENGGYNYEEIGECLLLLNKKEEAKPYFKKAHELLSQDIWLQANEKERLARLEDLSE